MLVLSRKDIEALLDLDALVDAVAAAMADLSAGRASMPSRIAAMVSERDALLAAMPAYLPSTGALATKLVSLFPRNTDRPTHQALIAVFDATDGTPLAVMDGAHITAARTAAGSALSARLLSRPESSTLAILGTGVQARAHAAALVRMRPVRAVRIAGRDPAKARRLAGTLAGELGERVEVTAVASWAEAMAGADIVCAATHSPDPVVQREYVAAGTHIASVGYNPAGVEVDVRTVADALVVVESRAAALAPVPAGSNDLQAAIEAGLLSESAVVEIGEIVSGAKPGRTSPVQITLYKSVGVAAQDAAAAALVLEAARAAGAGIQMEI